MSLGCGSLLSLVLDLFGDRGRLSSRGAFSGLNLGAVVLDRLVVILLLPPGGSCPFRVVPWAGIRVLATTFAFANTTKLDRDTLRVDVLHEFALVTAAKNVNLLDGDGIEPALDDAPDGREAPGGIDEEKLAQALGVVVLGDDGSLTNVGVDGWDLGQSYALEVHDGAASLQKMTGLAGTGGQTGIGDALVLDGKVGKHALGGGDFVHGSQINATKGLDVDGTAILKGRESV